MASFVVQAEDKDDAIDKVEYMINVYYKYCCETTPIVRVMVEGYERGMHIKDCKCDSCQAIAWDGTP